MRPSRAGILAAFLLTTLGAAGPLRAQDQPGGPPPGVSAPPPGTGATPSKAPASIKLDAKKPAPKPRPDAAFAAFQSGRFKSALDLAVQHANTQGDPVAMVLAAELLSQGYGVRQDAAAARKWLEAAAAKGNADALFSLGSIALASPSVQEKDRAVGLLKQSAEKGNAAAAYNLGLLYLQGMVAPKEPAIAADWFAKAADKDQPDALYALATLYRDGNGVRQDPGETARLLQRADEVGSPVATTELAIMVFNGTGVPKDEARAAELFRKAALAGNAIAQNRYARILSAGRGAAQDKVAAAAWHAAAKAQKLDDPMLDKMTAELSPQERAAVDDRVKTWRLATAP